MSPKGALSLCLGALALVTPSAFGQPAMLKFTFQGTSYQKDAAGNIVGVPITEQDLLKDRAQAGGVDPSTLAIVYHLGGDARGDTVEVVSAIDGSVQVVELGLWFGSDPNLGRSDLVNGSGTEVVRVDQIFTLSNSSYTSASPDGMGVAFATKLFAQDGSGNSTANVAGQMQWVANLASGAKIFDGTFTASSPFVPSGSAGSGAPAGPPSPSPGPGSSPGTGTSNGSSSGTGTQTGSGSGTGTPSGSGSGTADQPGSSSGTGTQTGSNSGTGNQTGSNPVTGTYTGLFYPASGITVSNSGALSVTVSNHRKITGTLLMAGMRYALRGTVDTNGSAAETITRRGAAPLSLSFQSDPSVPNQLTGTVTDGSFTADLSGQRATSAVGGNVPVQTGPYTVVIPGGDPAAGQPGGDSYGTMGVDRAGHARFIATLADGTRVSESGLLSVNGQFPLYVPLYGGRGALLGWLSFSGTDPSSDITGDITWIKPASSSRLYGAGFTMQSSAIGSAYAPPTRGKTVLAGSSAQVSFSGGDLPAAITDPIQITSKNRVANLGSNKMSLTFAPGNGTFRGTIADPGTGRTVPFGGVVLQKQNVGRGFFLGPDQSGEVTIQP